MDENLYFSSKYTYKMYSDGVVPQDELSKYCNKLILVESDWDDYSFHTQFIILYISQLHTNFYYTFVGAIKISHKDLNLDEENNGYTSYFLKKDFKEGDLVENLSDKNYYSIGNDDLYDGLCKYIKDRIERENFLINLNEISTIHDNGVIDKLQNEKWYELSLCRDYRNEKISEFTHFKNSINIIDNSYYVKNNLFDYNKQIKNHEYELLEWSNSYDLNINEAKSFVKLFSKISNLNSESFKIRNDILEKIQNKFYEDTELLIEIKDIQSSNKEFYEIIDRIKNILQINTYDSETGIIIGHYTSLETLSILLNNDKKNPPYLRLTNGRQMNDPMEGKVLLQFIYGNEVNPEEWENTFWYISSATTELDSLPMWKQYGSDATGGVLVYDSVYLKNLQQQNNVYLYKVAYLRVEGNVINIVNDNIIDEEKKKLVDNIELLKKIHIDQLSNLERGMLRDISFLFKKNDYSYEKEYRIITTLENNVDQIISSKNSKYNFPFLYSFLKNCPLKFSKIILGPKSLDIDYVGPFIKFCDKDIKIEKSTIAFR